MIHQVEAVGVCEDCLLPLQLPETHFRACEIGQCVLHLAAFFAFGLRDRLHDQPEDW